MWVELSFVGETLSLSLSLMKVLILSRAPGLCGSRGMPRDMWHHGPMKPYGV